MASRDPQVDAIVRELEQLAERVIAKITLDVVANLTEDTPVDTGWARANWIPAIGSPHRGTPGGGGRDERGRFTGASGGASGNPAAATAAQQAGLVELARYRLAQGKVYVSNNVPYILRLNDGYSSQAPAGFVQQAVARATTGAIVGLG